MKTDTGLVHMYYGDGKGKTTAAFGLALRCVGYGYKVVIAQFFKERPTGEVMAAANLPEITVLRAQPLSSKFTWQLTEEELEQLRENCAELFARTLESLSAGDVRLLILDECLDACAHDYLDMDALIGFLENKSPELEVCITGHSLPAELAPYADYISKVVKERHPFDEGITGRKSIEF